MEEATISGRLGRSLGMSHQQSKTSGWLSFFIACIIYVLGYWLISGSPPGVAGVMRWGSLIILFLLWGPVSAALSALSKSGG